MQVWMATFDEQIIAMTLLCLHIVLRKRQLFRRKIVLFIGWMLLVWYAGCLPGTLFDDSTSTVLLDKDGNLLGAHISLDEQWRFQPVDSVPAKFETCIIAFEDRNFYRHIGVSIKGISRAILQNFRNGERVSGGSTLTMQVIRLIRKNPKRTYTEKIIEMILATRLELSYSKKEILALYASHAPFGNNVVGIEAASWRFFNRPPHELSWAESATLAVLPNAPGLIYPGKNHDRLLLKRNKLLHHLHATGQIDADTYSLALREPLPSKPVPLPRIAPHLLQHFIAKGQQGKTIRSTIDGNLQQRMNQLIEDHSSNLRMNDIYNAALMITSVETGEVVAYIGNVENAGREHANFVNCIEAPRSSGSILKPILYMKALEAGTITPSTLLLDIPSKFGGFSPKNFAGNYDGLVPADQALSRSLNIPMVHLLNTYGLGKFHRDLNDLGFTSIRRHSGHYGLSLILGGAEVRLSELSAVYTNFARNLRNLPPVDLINQRTTEKQEVQKEKPLPHRGAIYQTFDAMTELKRPDEDNQWRIFSSSQKIAWKTGTSFGFRDAWSVGITPNYVVSVWIGNADGEGRPGLTGINAAAPLLFDAFRLLKPHNGWFTEPRSAMMRMDLCAESGQRATVNCPNIQSKRIPATCVKTHGCRYHSVIHLHKTTGERVTMDCASPMEIVHEPWFILPPNIEYFYQKTHPDHLGLPAVSPDCRTTAEVNSLHIVYPKNKQKLFLPTDLNEAQRRVIFEAVHQEKDGILFWHLDDLFIGQTHQLHQLSLEPSVGKHLLTITAENGEKKSVHFEILNRKKEAN